MTNHLITGCLQAIQDTENNVGFYNCNFYAESRFYKTKKLESLKERLKKYQAGLEEIAI